MKKTALITGASRGLGFGLAQALVNRGWELFINARGPGDLQQARNNLQKGKVQALSGDIRDKHHLISLAAAVRSRGVKLNLLVNNASSLGSSPLPKLLDQSVDELHEIYHTNVIAPVSLLQKLKSLMHPGCVIINISSDAAVEAYETWGAYGGSKAALDHLTRVLAKEYPNFRFHAFDPGDMRTAMHQAAYPGQDISDLPLPEDRAVPALLQLIDGPHNEVRYRVGQFKTSRV